MLFKQTRKLFYAKYDIAFPVTVHSIYMLQFLQDSCHINALKTVKRQAVNDLYRNDAASCKRDVASETVGTT